MHLDGTKPRKAAFISVLNALAALGSSAKGRQIHIQIVEAGLELDLAVANSLLNMYAKCGSMEAACEIFNRMQYKNIVTWNAMLGSGLQRYQQQELFSRMLVEGVRPDRVSFLTMLGACSSQAGLSHGKKLHSLISELEHLKSDTGVCNALVTMYSRCGSLEVSQTMFERMHQVGDLVTWNSMIAAYAQHGHVSEAIMLVKMLEQTGLSPDCITLTTILSACSHAGLLDDAHAYFHTMLVDYAIEPTIELYGSLVDLLCRAGRLAEAEDLIIRMPIPAGSAAWTTLLAAYSNNRDVARAKRAAQRLLELNPDDHGPYVTLSNTYRG